MSGAARSSAIFAVRVACKAAASASLRILLADCIR